METPKAVDEEIEDYDWFINYFGHELFEKKKKQWEEEIRLGIRLPLRIGIGPEKILAVSRQAHLDAMEA
ncbi:MAG: hypothetical protein J6T06_05415 [Victivallales bacterium]|nr:hypothetical protein [Victivallales bacterium]